METQNILESIGYVGVFISVFIECGVPIGIVLPLPGYTLLLTAGVFSSSGKMDPWIVLVVGILAAISGYVVGYFTGYKYGRKIFFDNNRKKYFTQKQGHITENFMKRFGYLTLIFGRFIAIVHNLAPIMGGIAKTPFLRFMVANVVGATLWVSSAVAIGYYLGQVLPNAEGYIIAFFVIVIIMVNTPIFRKQLKHLGKKLEKL